MLTAAPLRPREYQQAALDSISAYFEHRSGNPILVMPTGSGKSLIPALFCREVLRQWPNQRFMVLAHIKELLEQNYEKIVTAWPDAPVGLYSAGLGRRDTRQPIIVAGIQSVWRKPHVFGWRDIVFIDECHLLSPDSESMYQKFLAGLRATNSAIKLVGLTATAYRLKTGMLHQAENSLFTDVAYEVTLKELLEAGHISPLITRPSEVQADLSKVGYVGGEFNGREMATAMDIDSLTKAALDEVFALGGDRRSWLVFCAGVKHAGHVEEELVRRGKSAKAVTGETPADERERCHADFRSGKLECLVSVGVHTTGFDAPNIDLLVLLVGTESPGRYVQILGRGMRTAPGKKNCLVLDYAGNVERHGPITCVRPPRPAGASSAGEKHERTCLICPICRMASELGTPECADCGHVFLRERAVSHDTTATTADIMAAPPEPEWMPVSAVDYAIHEGKNGKPDTLKVTYSCGVKQFSEWVCFNHPADSFPRAKAETWWRKRTEVAVAVSAPHAFGVAEMLLKRPSAIKAVEDGKFWRIVSYDFSKRPGTSNSDTGTGDSSSSIFDSEPIMF